ncbi:MAG: hypothetical protein PHC70_02435 [Patescibacteria group bacterium]|nr:hypothetical protein [Patescibacteria group bacterium]
MSEINLKKRNGKPGWKWSYLVYFVLQTGLVAVVYYLFAAKGFLVPSVVYWLVIAMVTLAIILMALGIFKKNISYIWWEALLLLFAFCGVWILCLAVLPLWAAVMVAALLTVLPYLWPLTFWHDFSFLMGTLGVGLFAAIQFPFPVLLLVAAGIAIYEYLRLNQTQLATLYSEAFRAGLPPGILLPVSPSGWFRSIERTWQAGEGIILGLLPAIILAAVGLRVLRHGPLWLMLFGLLECLVIVVFGQDKQNRLRSWIFLAIAVAFYAFTGWLPL